MGLEGVGKNYVAMQMCDLLCVIRCNKIPYCKKTHLISIVACGV